MGVTQSGSRSEAEQKIIAVPFRAVSPKVTALRLFNLHAKIRQPTRVYTVATKQIPDTLAQTQLVSRRDQKVDVLVIGAGPTGLACGIEAQRAGFNVIVIDKGCVVNSLY